jgi:hypothetical protein
LARSQAICKRRESTRVGGEVYINRYQIKQVVLTLLVLVLEFLNDVVNEMVVEVFTTQVSVTGGCLTSKIPSPIVKRNSDSNSGRLVDDTEDVHTSYGTRALGSLLMGVVEVRGEGKDSIVDGVTQVRLENSLASPWY